MEKISLQAIVNKYCQRNLFSDVRKIPKFKADNLESRPFAIDDTPLIHYSLSVKIYYRFPFVNDSIKTIQHSASRFFSGTMMSRISGMLRDMVMAYAFGTQGQVASFMVAYRLSHACRRLFGEGAMQSALIPHFESLRHEDPARAFIFFRDLLFTVAFFLLGFIFLAFLGLHATMTWGHSAATQEILYLTALMLPSLLFICLFGLNASLLQCEKIYFTSAAAPIAFNVAWMAAVLIILKFPISNAMSFLSLGVIAACFLQWLMTVPQVLEILRKGMHVLLWSQIRLFSPDIKAMGKPFLLGLLGVGASQINSIIDTLFARFAEPEGPAFLWYAIRLQQLPLALFSASLASALLPPLSRAVQTKDALSFVHFLNDGVYKTLLLMLPLTFALFAFGDSCVNLLFGHGNFNDNSVWGTSRCLWAYGAGLVPTALVALLAPACYARNHFHTPALASCCNMALNFFLNALFIMQFGWGAVSVALATSLSAWVNLGWLAFFLAKQNVFELRILLPFIIKIFSASALSFLITNQMRKLFFTSAASLAASSQAPSFAHSMDKQLLELGTEATLFFGIFFLCMQTFKLTRKIF